MVKNLLVVILVLLNVTYFGQQWRTTTPLGGDLNDITFTDHYNGYAVCQGSSIGGCSNTLSLHKTIDAGESWIRLETGTSGQLKAVHFINQLTGWIACSSSEILKTTDGGVTWTQQTYGVGSGYNDIWFRDANNGFVLGNNGMLRRSTNGGASWQTITSGVSTTLRKIYFATNTLGFIACGDGQVLRTTNGGTSWTAITTGAGGLNDIFFVNSTHGYISSGSNLLETVDGGLTWTQNAVNPSYPILRIFFSSQNNGYLVVDGEGIYKTTNGGVSWTTNPTMNGIWDSWKSIYFTDDNTGYISGGIGKINKTTDGGVTWKSKRVAFSKTLMSVSAPHKDTAYFSDNDGKIYKTTSGGINHHQLTSEIENGTVMELRFLDTKIGFAGISDGRILKTIDGGENWITSYENQAKIIYDFSFISDSIGFAAADSGLVLRTFDQGASWFPIYTGYDQDLTNIWCTSSSRIHAIGGEYIFQSYTSGILWEVQDPPLSYQLKDIQFITPSLGYIVSSTRFMQTIDGGVTWEERDNTNGGYTINSMQFLNDSTAFMTHGNSQRYSIDSCNYLYSLSTACLANNYSMHDIAMTPDGNYGYSVGGLNGLTHQVEIPEITRTFTGNEAYCPGSSIFVGYFAKGYLAISDYTAQLSDASGDFTSPTIIGSFTTSSNVYPSGIITATIPGGTPSGTGYRIRVISSTHSLIGPDNGYDITISNSITPTVSVLASKTGNFCPGEQVTFSTNTFAGGLTPDFEWTVNGVPDGTSNNFISDTLISGDIIQVTLTSSLGCASPSAATSNSIAVVVNDSIHINLLDSTVCKNSLLQMTAPTGNSYLWSPDTLTLDATINNPIFTIPDSLEISVIVTDADGCFAEDTATILTWSLPTLSLNDTTLCLGDCLEMHPIIVDSLSSVSWTTSAVLSDNSILNPTFCETDTSFFVLQITDTNNCVNSDSMYVNVVDLPTVQLLDTTICIGSCHLINPIIDPASISFYAWNTSTFLDDSTLLNPTACVDSNSIFYLNIIDINNCSNSDSVSIFTFPESPTPSLTFDGYQIISSIGNEYQWYYNNVVVVDSINQTFVPNVSGDYFVEIQDVNMCTQFSDTISITGVNLSNVSNNLGYSLYPNPGSDKIAISIENHTKNETFEVSITHESGKIVFNEHYNQNLFKIDITDLAPGSYWVSIIDSKTKTVIQFIKED